VKEPTLTAETAESAEKTLGILGVSVERGELAFRAVTPASYTVKVELAGFRSLERRSNVLNASSQLDLGRRAGTSNSPLGAIQLLKT
jgi:hypothetical protein